MTEEYSRKNNVIDEEILDAEHPAEDMKRPTIDEEEMTSGCKRKTLKVEYSGRVFQLRGRHIV